MEHCVGELEVRVPDAAIEHCVEDDGVRRYATVHHHLENAERLVHVTADAITLYQCCISDPVWCDAVRLHLLQDFQSLVHVTSTCLRIDKTRVANKVHLLTFFPHLCEGLHSAIRITEVREALDESRIHYCIHCDMRLPRAEKRNGLVNESPADESIKHATERDVVWLHAALLHHLPPELPTARRSLQHTESLEEQTIRVYRRPSFGGVKGLNDPGQADLVSSLDAGIEHCVEKDLILAHVHARAVENG
mmetsp:Transcript_24770/g.62609  ORF Transcript_24770/g.62609 Transcript_24770/m.62609 type:complete len:249 (-) Transcript_24770:1338-2084(-)